MSMTKLRSRSLATHFRSLFTGGTLTGVGEGELLDRFVSRRDEAAFEELVARHGPMVLAVCRRWLDDPHDLEDAFQATFLILVRKAKALRNREALAPWLHGVSHRVARRAGATIRRRRERDSRAITESSITIPTSTTMNPQDELAGREVLAMVDDEILRLPENQRAAAVLCLVQGLSHEAAARALGWPLGTFKSRVAGARATLSRRLARRGLAPTAMAAIGGQAPDIPGCIVPPELSRRTVDAALRLVADPAMKAGVIGASVTGLMREVSRMTIRACLGMVLSALAALGLAVWATSVSRIVLPDTPRQVESSAATAEAAARTTPKPDPEAPPRRDLYGDPLPSGAFVRR
jgi:RNA polymerase sigma factor (sigma-70 family)